MKRDNLRMFRLARKLTQAAMAERCGVARVTYIKIERGERNPRPEFWLKLQSEFNISDADMFPLQKGGE